MPFLDQKRILLQIHQFVIFLEKLKINHFQFIYKFICSMNWMANYYINQMIYWYIFSLINNHYLFDIYSFDNLWTIFLNFYYLSLKKIHHQFLEVYHTKFTKVYMVYHQIKPNSMLLFPAYVVYIYHLNLIMTIYDSFDLAIWQHI